MEDSVCCFLLCTAHPSYPGVLEPLHLAVCVCPCCDLLRHTHVPHRPGAPGHHVLLHPEVLPSRLPVRAPPAHPGTGDSSCSAGELHAYIWSCQGCGTGCKWDKCSAMEMCHFTRAFVGSSSSRACVMKQTLHDQRFLEFTGHKKNPNWILSSPKGYVLGACKKMWTGKLKSACVGESGDMQPFLDLTEYSLTMVVLLAIKDPVCMSLLSCSWCLLVFKNMKILIVSESLLLLR